MREKTTQPKQKKRSRSRHFPIFDLEKALDRAHQLEQIVGTELVSTSVAIEHWGYSSKSSGGMRTLAALIQYGLLDEQGMKDTRRVRVSSIAKIILNSPDPNQKREAAQIATLKPPLYKEVWEHYAGKLPTDRELSWYLKGKEKPDEMILSGNSVDSFIKSFRATLDFAGLTGNGTLEAEGEHKPDIVEEPTKKDDLGSPPPSERGPAMPTASTAIQANFDLPIQLGSGLQGTLRLPNPMTEEQWKRFESAIESTKQLKTFLVSESPTEPADGSKVS